MRQVLQFWQFWESKPACSRQVTAQGFPTCEDDAVHDANAQIPVIPTARRMGQIDRGRVKT